MRSIKRSQTNFPWNRSLSRSEGNHFSNQVACLHLWPAHKYSHTHTHTCVDTHTHTHVCEPVWHKHMSLCAVITRTSASALKEKPCSCHNLSCHKSWSFHPAPQSHRLGWRDINNRVAAVTHFHVDVCIFDVMLTCFNVKKKNVSHIVYSYSSFSVEN